MNHYTIIPNMLRTAVLCSTDIDLSGGGRAFTEPLLRHLRTCMARRSVQCTMHRGMPGTLLWIVCGTGYSRGCSMVLDTELGNTNWATALRNTHWYRAGATILGNSTRGCSTAALEYYYLRPKTHAFGALKSNFCVVCLDFASLFLRSELSNDMWYA